MDQHTSRIALRPSESAMFDGRRGRDAITVFIGRFGCAQTYDQVVNQVRKMTCTFLIAKMEMVKLRSFHCS